MLIFETNKGFVPNQSIIDHQSSDTQQHTNNINLLKKHTMKKNLLCLFILLMSGLTAKATLVVSRALPADGSANVDINSRVILMFDKNIEQVLDCTLDGEAVQATVTNRMTTFVLPSLDYSTTYRY